MSTERAAKVGTTPRTLPFSQEVVAWFKGAWLAGYAPRWKRRPWWYLVTTVLSLCGGVAVSSLSVRGSSGWWLLLVGSWLLTVHGARKAQLCICHRAAHANLTGSARGDRVVAEVLSALLLIQAFDRYRKEHLTAHHGPALATPADPDVQFLFQLGFQPGMSRTALWRQLYGSVLSPRFHSCFLRVRLHANFVTAPGYRRVMAAVSAIVVVGGLAGLGGWPLVLVAWGIPVFPLYHIAALLQFVSEHLWWQGMAPGHRQPEGDDQPHALRVVRGRLTLGRFVGDPLPSRALPLGQWLWAWSRWVARLLLVHIPTRMCVLPGDLCQHDWHHRHPRGDWSNAGYERQRDLDAGCPGWPEPYRDVWGLGPAIDLVFAGLASLPPLPASTSLAGDVTDAALSM